jgi:3'-phosphoadenosine 5'-phosphosulfate (PAPS) 3'-phosphatase
VEGEAGNAGVSVCGLLPYAGDAAKAGRLGRKAADAGRKEAKAFSSEKQALVDMDKRDKRKGISEGDMQAYKDLNQQLPDSFPQEKVRGPEQHAKRKSPTSQKKHGCVGPVNHIPIIE